MGRLMRNHKALLSFLWSLVLVMDEIKEKVIYVAAPYGGCEGNKDRVERIIKKLVKQYPNYCFLSPIHALGFLYFEMEYNEGMEHCLTLLDLCSELWVFGESKGTIIEKEYAKKYRIPIREIRMDI